MMKKRQNPSWALKGRPCAGGALRVKMRCPEDACFRGLKILAMDITGFLETAGLAYLRGRFHWFPLHPIGLAFQYSPGLSIYWFTLLIVWITKFSLLRYGGSGAYQAGKPFFYGLGVGYVAGVVLSGFVDAIWFPGDEHRVHYW